MTSAEPSPDQGAETGAESVAESAAQQLSAPGADQPASPGPESSPALRAAGLTPGCAVKLLQRPSYLKTADSMPMLRPPDLVDLSEVGEVVALRPLGTVAVRFRRGTFLIDGALLRRQGEGAAG